MIKKKSISNTVNAVLSTFC